VKTGRWQALKIHALRLPGARFAYSHLWLPWRLRRQGRIQGRGLAASTMGPKTWRHALTGDLALQEEWVTLLREAIAHQVFLSCNPPSCPHHGNETCYPLEQAHRHQQLMITALRSFLARQESQVALLRSVLESDPGSGEGRRADRLEKVIEYLVEVYD